jgi:flagellar basal-body rod protein FlgF
MNTGLLNAASALDLIAKMQDAHAQNLANASTTGYRKRLTSAEVFSNALKQASGIITPKPNESIDFSPGDMRSTGQPLDVAIDGPGFFAVEHQRGERYTRAGAFQLDGEGFLVTVDGKKVAGETGPIQVDPTLGTPSIDAEGKVVQRGESVGRLKVVEFEDTRKLIAEDGGYFRPGAGMSAQAAESSKIRQEHLESSNVDVVDELVQMIAGFRAFESAQRTLLGIDRVKNESINGR